MKIAAVEAMVTDIFSQKEDENARRGKVLDKENSPNIFYHFLLEVVPSGDSSFESSRSL